MFLADCPNCRKPILIPGNHMKAVAQCPLCEYEFSVEGIAATEVLVAEILRSDFSTLDGETTASPDQTLNFDLSNQESKPNAPTGTPDGGSIEPSLIANEPRPEFDFPGEADDETKSPVKQAVPSPFTSGDVGESEIGPSVSRDTTIAASRHSTRRERRSPVFEVVKILGGGVAGLAIAQLILWWLPGSWRRDPLGLAPQLPAYVAFAAPEALRFPNGNPHDAALMPPPDISENHVAVEPVGKIQANETKIDLGNVGVNRTSIDQQTDSQEETADPNTVDLNSNSVEPQEIPLPQDDGADENAAENAHNETSVPVEIASSVEIKDQPLADEQPTDEGAPVTERVVGLIDSPVVTVDQFNESLDGALALSAALGDKQDAPKTARREFYVRLAELGRSVTYLDPVAQVSAARWRVLEDLLTSVGNDRFRFHLIGASVSGWLNFSGRNTAGVVVAGYCRQIHQVGEMFVTKIELAGRPDRFMNVMSKTDPRSDEQMPLAIDQRVIVLGVILDRPGEQISGYDGEATMLIWQGKHVTLEPNSAD